jgi:hypothetical protein
MFFFFSCTKKKVQTEEINYSKKFYLSNDTSKGALNVDFHIEIPVDFKDKRVLDSIRTKLITNLFGKEFMSQKSDSLLIEFAKSLNADYYRNNAPLVNELDSTSSYSFNNEHTLDGFALLSDKNIFSYGIDRYVYMGGAHGLNNRLYFNFDLTTGKLITEKDIFKSNYKLTLSLLIKKRIIEESREEKNEDTEQISSLEDTDYWIDSIVPNGNFYITDESINYVFNPYEIAPYYMGQTDVTLPFNRLTNLLKPNSVIDYLVQKQNKK